MSTKLKNEDRFPDMSLNLTGGGSIELPAAPEPAAPEPAAPEPAAPEGGYQIVLFYRGSF